jgi:hypothetical protein
VHLATQAVSVSGGNVGVSGSGTTLDGFQITVRPKSFSTPRTFTVATRPVLSHILGPDFNPISPLITIECGGGRADSNMLVRIPAHVPAGEFAMGFYYDSITGELEGLPVVAYDSTGVTLVARHFSDLILTSINRDKLMTLNVSSGFEPGVDDWEFPNFGSSVCPGGQCNGQSIAAMWYYLERKVRRHEAGLFNRYSLSSRLWQANPRGYRLSSAMQKGTSSASFNAAIDSYDQWNAPDLLDFLAFAYAIDLTHRPQLVNILSIDGNSGHALIAYKIVGPTMLL